MCAKKRVIVKKEKKKEVAVAAADTISKLNKSAQNIVNIAYEELQKLLRKVLIGQELDNNEIKKLESLSRIINSQQKHAIDIEKLRIEVEKAKDPTTVNNNLIVTEEQLKQLKESYKNEKSN